MTEMDVTEEQVEAAARVMAEGLYEGKEAWGEYHAIARAALEAAAKAQPRDYTDFDTWFHEQEGTSLRSERFNGDVEWLKAAFDAGRSAQPSISTGQGEPEERVYLIRKSGAWYRPQSQGYTYNVAEAGRFTLAEAEKITHPNGPSGPRDGLSFIHQNEVASSLPAGHVAVPMEPTEEMIKAGLTTGTRFGPKAMRNIYRAMLEAIPHNQGEGK